MAELFDCPTCGAPLHYNGGPDLTITCPFCKNSVIVPETLRTASKAGPTAASTPNINNKLIQFIQLMLSQGKKTEVIAFYCRLYHVDLIEGKNAVERIEAGNLILPPLPSSQPAQAAYQSPDVSGLIQQIQHLLYDRKEIEAIKLYRAYYNVGLAEAKMAVERIGGGDLTMPPIPNAQEVAQRLTQAELARQTSAGKKSNATCLIIVSVLVVLIIAGTVLIPIVISAGSLAFPGVAKITHTFASQVASFGSEGTDAGNFTDLRSIAVDPDGNIYTAEYQTGRIQVFDSSGKFINLWNLPPKTIIRALAADRSGGLYVLTGEKLDRYDGKSGKLLNSISYKGDSGMDFGFNDVVVAPDGTVVASWNGDTDDILFFDSSGQFIRKIKEAISGQSGEAELDMKIAVDGLGNVYALGTFNAAVFKYGSGGKFVTRFGGEGKEPGQFLAPESIAVDGKGRVYIGDMGNIDVFDADGRYLDTFDVGGTAFGMVFNDQGDLLIAARDKILKYRINDLK